MNIIRPNVELWKQGNTIEDIWNHIARCVRVCYQTTPKGADESEEAFVKRVLFRDDEHWNSVRNHLAMLEHGTIYLKIPFSSNSGPSYERNKFYERNKYSKVIYDTDNTLYVTTNLRVIIENYREHDLKYLCAPTLHAKRYTFCFTTNIGVSREFNRHRVNSIAEESTRYCNYSKKNDGQIKIVLPAWLIEDKFDIENYYYDLKDFCDDIVFEGEKIDENWSATDYYMFALKSCEFAYNNLIKLGWLPQQAREVLPLATKTQLVHTAFEDDWKHFIALRSDGVSGKPHPNAKILADKVKEILKEYL